MLNIAEGSMLQIAHHVRRYAINAADLRYLKFAGFQKLSFAVWYGDGRIAHVLFQHGHLAGVDGAAVGRVPALPQLLRILYRIGMSQDTAGSCAVGEELAAVFLGGKAETDGVLFQRNGAVAHDSVEAQSGNVQHVLRAQAHHLALAGGVVVDELSTVVPVHLHLIRQQRIQPQNVAAPVAQDLAVGVAVNQEMGEHDLPQDEAGHLGVRLVVQDAVQRMLRRLDAALALILIYVQGQAGDGLGDDAHTGIDRAHLDGGGRRDGFAGRAGAEIEGGSGADAVRRFFVPSGLVPRPEQRCEWIFHGVLLLLQSFSRFPVMAALAKGLPVIFIPEKIAISAMRHDVVYHGRRGQRAAFQAIRA